MRRPFNILWKGLLKMGLALFVLMVVVVLALIFSQQTVQGQKILDRLVSGLLTWPPEHATEISGLRIRFNPPTIHLERLRLKDRRGMWLDAEKLVGTIDLEGLWSRHFVFPEVHIDHARWERIPEYGGSNDSSSSSWTSQYMAPRIVCEDLTTPVFLDSSRHQGRFEGSLSLGAPEGLSIRAQWNQTEPGSLTATSSFAWGPSMRCTLSASGDSNALGAISRKAGGWNLQAEAAGNTTVLTVTGQCQTAHAGLWMTRGEVMPGEAPGFDFMVWIPEKIFHDQPSAPLPVHAWLRKLSEHWEGALSCTGIIQGVEARAWTDFEMNAIGVTANAISIDIPTGGHIAGKAHFTWSPFHLAASLSATTEKWTLINQLTRQSLTGAAQV
ncbi:MAG: hypothetical protein V2A34_16195, partial [Lentisphaerota bacterium]